MRLGLAMAWHARDAESLAEPRRVHESTPLSPKPPLCLALALSPWLPGLLLTSSVAQAGDNLGSTARFAVPMSCAAVALIRGAEYPETIRVYDGGYEARSAAEADRALLGLSWRHRQ